MCFLKFPLFWCIHAVYEIIESAYNCQNSSYLSPRMSSYSPHRHSQSSQFDCKSLTQMNATQLQFLVTVIIRSVPELGNVFGLSAFVWYAGGWGYSTRLVDLAFLYMKAGALLKIDFVRKLVRFVFGIVGVQLFAGATRGACYDHDTGLATGVAPCAGTAPPPPPPGSVAAAQADPIQDLLLCNSGEDCLLLGFPPNGGVTQFDSILAAFMNIFQVLRS